MLCPSCRAPRVEYVYPSGKKRMVCRPGHAARQLQRRSTAPEKHRVREKEYRARNAVEINARMRRKYAENSEPIKASARKYRAAYPDRLKDQRIRSYGLNIEQFRAMLAAQAGVCAICKGPPRGKGTYHIDHDHVTGQVRGLLCSNCNVGLGNFQDRADLLVAAVAYLAAERYMGLVAPRLVG